jgi:uncharacterized damage-inducible protein DinB
MNPLSALAERFAFNDKLLDTITADFDDHDWHRRAGDGNHAQWLLGHLAASRRRFLRGLLPSLEEQPWEGHFGLGRKPTPQSDDIAPALLREAFLKNGALLREQLQSLTAAQADAPHRPTPDGAGTVGGAAHFIHFHETYHLGQLGLLRRLGGRKGFA